MDEKEMVAALVSIKREEEEETRPLRERIDRARLVIERYEGKLRAICAKYDQRYQELLTAFRGSGKVPSLETPTQDEKASRVGKRSLDEPLLSFLKEIGWQEEEFTVSHLAQEWNRRHPEMYAGRATIRGVLDRLAKQQKNVVVCNEGGRGNSNPRTYLFYEE